MPDHAHVHQCCIGVDIKGLQYQFLQKFTLLSLSESTIGIEQCKAFFRDMMFHELMERQHKPLTSARFTTDANALLSISPCFIFIASPETFHNGISANVRHEFRFIRSWMDFSFEQIHSSMKIFSWASPSCLAFLKS